MSEHASGTAKVYVASSLAEAEMIKGLLEGEGLIALIPGEMATDPVITAEETMVVAEVHVKSEELSRARQVILRAREQGKQLEGWLADHPGETPLSE